MLETIRSVASRNFDTEKALVLVLFLLAYWCHLNAAFHIDTARDLALALDIASGRVFHLAGPEIAHSFHLGPIWLYLLAAPLALGATFGVLAHFVAILSASSVVLAWRIGRVLGSPRLAVMFPLIILLPNWKYYYWLSFTHTVMTAPALLATFLVAIGYAQAASQKRAALLGLAIGFSLHGHPTVLPIMVLILLPFATPISLRTQFAHVVLAGLCSSLLFFPYFFQQASSGFPDYYATHSYVNQLSEQKPMRVALNLAYQTFIGGAKAGGALAIPGSPMWASLCATTAWLVFSIGWAGALFAPLEPNLRKAKNVALVLALSSLFLVAWSRIEIRFYMTDGLWIFGAALAALGWTGLIENRRSLAMKFSSRVFRFGLLTIAATNMVVWVKGLAQYRYVAQYDWVLNILVESKKLPVVVDGFIPLRKIDKLADIFCQNQWGRLHGDGAVISDLISSVVILRHCPTQNFPVLGGKPNSTSRSLAGLECGLMKQFGFSVQYRIGSICWIEVIALNRSTVGLTASDARRYLPRQIDNRALQSYKLELPLARPRMIVATRLLPWWSSYGMISITQDGREFSPYQIQPLSNIWVNNGQLGSGPLTIKFDATVPEHMDVFALM